MKKVFLDFDNTLVNTNEVAIRYFNEMFEKDFSITQLKRYNFSDLYDHITRKDIEYFFESDYLFDNIEFVDDCWNKLKTLENRIEIVTVGTGSNLEKKKNWISKNMNEKIVVHGVKRLDHDKSSVDMSGGIFVDDHIKCIRTSNADEKILFEFFQKGDWNERDNLDELYAIDTWDDIIETIKFFINQKGM